ncbi:MULTISPECIES: hypothetical protein [Streptomycetaceae]|uniref:hypothetical protein n=1 Tax=Streptomycetaceae TaxID=2062 RepID=UPI00021401B3|nr:MULTISPECIES: hypothetical protein [Streptomycetaceae]MYS61456.1 hypothetical protein [Streptomyces sp. SID5468]CCB77314.1 conserved membrane protein of unknown function [Streptantibioticus cattleyicolor NRRL 8057 = DSM 46488]
MDDKGETRTKTTDKRIDLSLTQVAGSAAAAVTAAVLASFLGVYGTVIGAAVVSVVATTGGVIYQHLFRRTGEQLREVTVLTRPQRRGRADDGRTGATGPAPAAEEPGTVLTASDAPYGDGRTPWYDSGYGEGTVHGTRWRGWRRSLAAAGAVFLLAMLVITGIELLTGPVYGWFHHGAGGGTSVGRVFGGGSGKPAHPPVHRPSPGDLPSGGGHPTTPAGGASSAPGRDGTGDGASRSPGTGQTPGTGGDSPSPSPSGHPSTGPTRDEGAGQGGQDNAGPGAGGTGQAASPPAAQPSGAGQ